MKLGILTGLFLFWANVANAYIISPTSIEVKFAYDAEFQTSQTLPADQLIRTHSEYLFGYLQSPELAVKWGINHRTDGWGAAAWPPSYRLISDMKAGQIRTIKYHIEGVWLLNKQAATPLLIRGSYQIIVPYDLDHYYDPKCVAEGDASDPDDFSYFYDPYLKGCEALAQSPLAANVTVQLAPMPAVNEAETADLAGLRGDNGNGELFEIMSVTGFAEKGGRSDDARAGFTKINQWLVDQGFSKIITQHYKDRPVYQFDKDILTPDHRPVHIRMTRLLVNTDLDGELKTFSNFFKAAIESADVVMFVGHSGSSFVLDPADIERHAGKLKWEFNKRQIYFLDACTGYSYFLPMFQGRKAPGTTQFLTFGLTTQFGFERPMHTALLRYLFDFKQDTPKWMDMMTDVEKALRGMTFMLNVEIN